MVLKVLVLFERLSTEKIAGKFVPGTDVSTVAIGDRKYEEIHAQTRREDEKTNTYCLRGDFLNPFGVVTTISHS